MELQQKRRQILQQTRTVLEESQLPNGAIVASSSEPTDLQDYRFVWLRDASFVLYAGKLLGIRGMQQRFLSWLEEHCADYKDTGRVYKNYTVHGARAHDQYQPDQIGALLWALLEGYKGGDAQVDRVSKRLATALADTWRDGSFILPVFDLWESRWVEAGTVPFVYTLAAASAGLEIAATYHGVDKWHQNARQMRALIETNDANEYLWRPGHPELRKCDGSLLGLAWPFGGGLDEQAVDRTVHRVEETLLTPEGIRRFLVDPYDGHLPGKYPERGGGGWPVLSFWYVTVLVRTGQQDDAHEMFEQQLGLIPEDNIIPEQYFADSTRVAIRPLAWSHAMFAIACAELGLL